MKFILLFLGLLERQFRVRYNEVDEEKRKEWLYAQYQHDGFLSYFKWRDYSLLKSLGSGLEPKVYWTTVGQRLELLSLMGFMKHEYDRLEKEKKKEEKKE